MAKYTEKKEVEEHETKTSTKGSIYEYKVSTPFDIRTASFSQRINTEDNQASMEEFE